MAHPRPEVVEFLRMNNLDIPPYLSPDDEAGSSPFDTLWTEFARSHPRLSPPRSPVLPHSRSASSIPPTYGSHIEPSPLSQPAIDLRALEYVTEYDTNLMCPICHVPFIDPVVLDCDHTFCGECFDTYHNSVSGSDRSRCPACRAYHLGGSRRANRLIRNMASEVRVKCPNTGCDVVTVRSRMEMHATRECLEQEMTCPVGTCGRPTKRKNFVHDTCIHDTHIECGCGATIRLGRGEWIRHKDEQCPNSVTITSQPLQDVRSSHPPSSDCPGTSYGCSYADPSSTSPDHLDLAQHVSTCTFAKLAPFLQKQENLVKTLQRSLEQEVHRNEVLESGLDRLNDIILHTIQPKVDQISSITYQNAHDNADAISEIEEIPRSPSSLQHTLYAQQQLHYAQPDPALSSTLSTLTDRITSLENQHHTSTSDTHRAIRDLDARTSLCLMNETLRIREELAHLNGGMYSTRAQVTYLLNHHRLANQQVALNGGNISGLARGLSNTLNNTGNTTQTNQSTSMNTQNQTAPQSIPTSATTTTASIAGSSTSTGTSPSLNPIFNTATRPNLRRGSGGSASGSRSSIDRVKL